jgi:hypothetical protein
MVLGTRIISDTKEVRKMERKMTARWMMAFWGIAFTLLFFPERSVALSCVASLKGLEGVEVLVEELKSEVESFNITAIQIQSDVEAKLRMAGIKVLSKEENEKAQSSRRPYLYIRINSYKPPWEREVVIFNMDLALNQQVVLPGKHKPPVKPFYAPTWYTDVVGFVSWKNISTIRESANNLMDKFIEAYLSVNPQKRPAPSPAKEGNAD